MTMQPDGELVRILPPRAAPLHDEQAPEPTWVRKAIAWGLRAAADRAAGPLAKPAAPARPWVSRGGPLKLHIGCNETRLEGFVNIDARATPATDLVHFCRDLAPFGAGQAATIFANAFFEHLYLSHRIEFLRETHRVLEPGGFLHLTGIPDFEGVARAYLAKAPGHVSARFDVDEAYRYTHGCPEQAPAWWLEQLHKSLIDGEKLQALLAAAGFRDWFVFRYAWGNESNAVNLGVLAQKSGPRRADREAIDRIIGAFIPVTNVNRDKLEVGATTF